MMVVRRRCDCGMMPFAKKCRWPWSLIATIVPPILVVIFSLIHIFVHPLFPSSIIPTNIGEPRSSLSSTDNSKESSRHDRFQIDSHHGAVHYRAAPWRDKIGRWLLSCDSITSSIDVIEKISGIACFNDCSGHGICNRELGHCRCFHGYDGIDCSKKLQFDCNYPSSSDQPYGRWVVSICPAHCDTKRAMCFCGSETKYPNRPVAEACGFQLEFPSVPGSPVMTNWSKADLDNIFTVNSSRPGWCNVHPDEAYTASVRFKEQCDCKYDCLSGRFCEIPTVCSCLNQCSMNGHCRGGFCECEHGWYGADCSIPSDLSPLPMWPKWLRPASINLPNSSGNGISAVVKKRRPLIYVYDLPPQFNIHLLEGRHYKFQCINRLYTDDNVTFWTDQLYGAQIALYESILSSPHRTLNGDEADYFFIPVLDACLITRADDAPHLSMEEYMGLRSYFSLDLYKKAYDHVVQQYPFWNRSLGRDHIWFFAWDEGACYAPKEIWNSIMLTHWGNTNLKHNYSTTAYFADKWDKIPIERRGSHPCFDPVKDVVLPAWKRPNPDSLKSKLWSWSLEQRKRLFYFNGNLGSAYVNGRPESTYSLGLRQRLAEEFGSIPNKQGKLGKQYSKNVTVTSERSHDYAKELASSMFCGVLPGDGWSGRMEDSVLHGCIPVIIQDGILLPFENVLDYQSFAVRVREDQISSLVQILQGLPMVKIEAMLNNVQKIWQRFIYRDSVLLEAERQRHLTGREDDWAVEYLNLEGDDAFATFIQVLHYKLHNDPWRFQQKQFGLPEACIQIQ